MTDSNIIAFVKKILQNMPKDWLELTTHRLDIYDESQAKVQFLEKLEGLFKADIADEAAMVAMPTAYDYIRLGHPLSCVLEWSIASLQQVPVEHVISFSSSTIGVLAVLRTNKLKGRPTQICHVGDMPSAFDEDLLKSVYGYEFEILPIESTSDVPAYEGSTVLVKHGGVAEVQATVGADFVVTVHPSLGSTLMVCGDQNATYIADIQHVRRRETIAMTPSNCEQALRALVSAQVASGSHSEESRDYVRTAISSITATSGKPLVGSSGLSVQYAIMMGLVHDAQASHDGKAIKLVVPPNCYGGTNDQARRVAASIDNVEVVDLPVDGDSDMVQSIDTVLTALAESDAIPYIIAEIPTNPRVEVPDLQQLQQVLTKERYTAKGEPAVSPVFVLDQTFCPNVHFLGEGEVLSGIKAVSYASGSKFPSGGRCTAGYVVANEKAQPLMQYIEQHMTLCDNEATPQQYQILAEQLPSMNDRIKQAYANTRDFVNYIAEVLPAAKINFVSDELAAQGFTPSVFSLDLPTKGDTDAEREAHKRQLNLDLIHRMISQIPTESKFCVSYGQLKGCYWTVPATSTQGTTKEGDKDYIVRASLSPDLDMEKHKEVFRSFVDSMSIV